MSQRKYTPYVAALVALVFVVAAVALVWRLVNGDSSLLRNVSVGHALITPNADGQTDATPIQYTLSRNANVSIYFENTAGERFYFRRAQPRGAGDYRVLFSGVVDGYRLPGETSEGEILARLLQDGGYTWTVEAADDAGVTEQAQGVLAIADADPVLPEIRGFTVWPPARVFTPNRDGIDDRVQPQFWLEKDVAEIRVFLLGDDGAEYPITALERDVPTGTRGQHVYDYDAGIDDGATPPPDGAYRLVAIARDLAGQAVRVEDELTIRYGGVPRADIFSPPTGRTLRFEATAVALCDTLWFEVTIRNYGSTPIRTTGPAPGMVYDSNWNYNTLGWGTESGAWRVGIGFENALSDYPFRWAVGNPEDLELIDGRTYLMPGERAVVRGGIRIVDVLGKRNPQPMWAGLIHEDVEVAQFNSRVDPHSILIDIPDPDNRPECEPREIPVRVEAPQP